MPPGSHVRRQGPWKPISVPNRFGINGKEKPPSNGKLHIKFLPLPSIIDITLARIYKKSLHFIQKVNGLGVLHGKVFTTSGKNDKSQIYSSIASIVLKIDH